MDIDIDSLAADALRRRGKDGGGAAPIGDGRWVREGDAAVVVAAPSTNAQLQALRSLWDEAR